LKKLNLKHTSWINFIILFFIIILFRPIIAVDETRYLSVAWEMYLSKNYLLPLTLNFELYHHKPPLIFWLINLSWNIFGISRFSSTFPFLITSFFLLISTKRLAQEILNEKYTNQNIIYYLLGSLCFLIYGFLILFDITLTLFIICSLIYLVKYSKSQKYRYSLKCGFFLGLALLTKGPVAFLHILPLMFLINFWTIKKISIKKWTLFCFISISISLLIFLVWLVPVLLNSTSDFKENLVFSQLIDRIYSEEGKTNLNIHSKPFWFYFVSFPALLLPWIFSISFFKKLILVKKKLYIKKYRILFIWIISVIFLHTLIEGKQFHYILPILPAVIILFSKEISEINYNILVVNIFFVVLIILHIALYKFNIFDKYNLVPLANYIKKHENKPIGYIGKYSGEITYLGKLKKKIDEVEKKKVELWFKNNPNGLLLFNFNKKKDEDITIVKNYKLLFEIKYKSRDIGVFSKQNYNL